MHALEFASLCLSLGLGLELGLGLGLVLGLGLGHQGRGFFAVCNFPYNQFPYKQSPNRIPRRLYVYRGL